MSFACFLRSILTLVFSTGVSIFTFAQDTKIIPTYSLQEDEEVLQNEFNVVAWMGSTSQIVPSNQEHWQSRGVIRSHSIVEYEDRIYWYAVKLRNDSDKTIERYIHIDETFMDNINFHFQENNQWIVVKNGLKVPLNERSIPDRTAVTQIIFQPHEVKTIYVSIQTKLDGVFGLYIRKESNYRRWEQLQTIGYWLYFGASLSILLYNLFLLFVLRETLYLYYCLYQALLLTYTFVYSSFQQFIPIEAELFYDFNATIGFSVVFQILFIRKFLKTKDVSLAIDRGLILFMYIGLFVSTCTVVDVKCYDIMEGSALIIIPYMTFVGIYALFKRVVLAQFYFIGMVGYFIGMVLIVGLSVDLIEFSFISRYSYLIGSLFEMVTFSIALGYRVKLYQAEKVEAQNEAILIQTQLLNLERTNTARLENVVTERTKELQNANTSLKARNERIEFLFKEVHHRVKNNLQTISSLLHIQADRIKSEQAKIALIEGQRRIDAICIMHQNIYLEQSEVGTEVNFSPILKAIVGYIDSAYYYDTQLIYKVEDIKLSLDDSLTFSLILNELVTNCYKHAFTNEMECLLTVFFTKDDDYLYLRVCDNGEKETNLNNQQGAFGIELLHILMSQSQSKFTFNYNKGLMVEVKTPIKYLS